jgi:hypothetical protein
VTEPDAPSTPDDETAGTDSGRDGAVTPDRDDEVPELGAEDDLTPGAAGALEEG